jgi:hypothetical protein
MTKIPDDVQGGFSSLHDILFVIETGHFYEDHDESLALLGRAKDGFEAIRSWVAAQQEEA